MVNPVERIGIAASKISKGNLLLYNGCVVAISFLFSLFIFIIAGASVFFSLMVISYIATEIMGIDFARKWTAVFGVCMITLTVLAALFNLLAISKNIKFRKVDDQL